MEIQKYEKESIGAIGQEISKLGFGLMRLPKKGLSIDIRQTEQMVDAFLEAGFTYFDTAFGSGGQKGSCRQTSERILYAGNETECDDSANGENG